MSTRLHQNLSMRQAVRQLRRLGCDISNRPGTDEYMIRPPGGGPILRPKMTRKDATIQMAALIRSLKEAKE